MEKLYVNIAKMATAAMLANGQIDAGEMEFCKYLAEDLEQNWADFEKEIKAAEKEINGLKGDDAFDAYVEKCAKEIPEDKRQLVFESMTHIMLADGTFDEDELVVLSVMADALEVSSDDIIGTIAYAVANKDGLKVNL